MRGFSNGVTVEEDKILLWLNDVVLKRTVKGSKRRRRWTTGEGEAEMRGDGSSGEEAAEPQTIKYETVEGWVAAICTLYHEQVDSFLPYSSCHG